VRWTALIDVADAQRFGGKAASLARAIRAGLPVPPGLALADAFVTAIGEGDRTAAAELADLPLPRGRELAVRSSAAGEDSAIASFAGQHASRLGVLPGEGSSKQSRRSGGPASATGRSATATDSAWTGRRAWEW
jgi:pyruvate, water dikinase